MAKYILIANVPWQVSFCHVHYRAKPARSLFNDRAGRGDTLSRPFSSLPSDSYSRNEEIERITIQAPCHLRSQRKSFANRQTAVCSRGIKDLALFVPFASFLDWCWKNIADMPQRQCCCACCGPVFPSLRCGWPN